MPEKWKAIPGWEGLYEASSSGRIRTVARVVCFSDGRVRSYAKRLRKLHVDGSGYWKVTLKGNGRNARCLVHQLVAAAWLGPRPEGREVCHNNGDRSDSRARNLRYGTRKENAEDSRRHGTSARPRKLSEKVVKLIREARGLVPQAVLAARHGTSKSHVCNIQLGKRRTL